MADYLVESSFQIDDKQATRALQNIFARLEKIETKLADTIKMFGTLSVEINKLSVTGASAGDIFKVLNSELGGTNTRLSNMATRLPQATLQMADMGAEADYVAGAMTNMARATRAAGEAAALSRSQFRGFGMGGGGGRGGGGEPGGHRMGFFGGMGHHLNTAANAAFMGMIGLDFAKEGLKPGLEYIQAQSKFNTVGLASASEKATAKREAERIATQLGISSPANVLEDIYHMYGVTKSMPLAIQQAARRSTGASGIWR